MADIRRAGGFHALAFALFASLATACGGSLDEAAALDEDVTSDSQALIDPSDPPPPPSLKTVKVPEPSNLMEFVRNKTTAIALGKALFWDMQLGSDGIQACASCHFHAGADSRSKNQLGPGLNRVSASLKPNPDRTFQTGGPNYQLEKSDFPFRQLKNPDDRRSKVLSDSNDVVSSQGVTASRFVDVKPGQSDDAVQSVRDPDGFRVDGHNTRRAQERNAPSVINAVFNHRNFWDGRAQNIFNGVNALGARDKSARVFRVEGDGVRSVQLRIDNASLASQAMEPPLGPEMSADGRTFEDIGEKVLEETKVKGGRRSGCPGHSKPGAVLSLRPLGRQEVASDDSVLGRLSRLPKPGLTVDSYRDLIEDAFQPAYWRSNRLVRVDGDKRTLLAEGDGNAKDDDVYSLMESNFTLFFGLAIQLYEATLVSDDTPYDRYQNGDKKALTAQQKFGLDLFVSQTRGRCINCHGGPEFTDASVTRWSKNQIRRREGNVLDFGYNNIGMRPTLDDLGNGADDEFGNPLSVTRLALIGQFKDPSVSPPLDPPREIEAADGAFKVPGLRNVELTAPYTHTGGFRTLREVLDFYSRGGDFLPIKNRKGETLSPLTTLKNSEDEKDALEAFLHALTDERVRYQRAPFDHPQLFVPNGHKGDDRHVCVDRDGDAEDEILEIEAIGKRGGSALPNFLEER